MGARHPAAALGRRSGLLAARAPGRSALRARSAHRSRRRARARRCTSAGATL